jgi:hypothetical protein
VFVNSEVVGLVRPVVFGLGLVQTFCFRYAIERSQKGFDKWPELSYGALLLKLSVSDEVYIILFFKTTTLYVPSMAGFDLTTHGSSLFGGRQRRYHAASLTSGAGPRPCFEGSFFNMSLPSRTLTPRGARWPHLSLQGVNTLNFIEQQSGEQRVFTPRWRLHPNWASMDRSKTDLWARTEVVFPKYVEWVLGSRVISTNFSTHCSCFQQGCQMVCFQTKNPNLG